MFIYGYYWLSKLEFNIVLIKGMIFLNDAGLPEHWLKRQRKVQEGVEGVQRKNEAYAERRSWAIHESHWWP